MRESRIQAKAKLELLKAGAYVIIIHGGPHMPVGEPDIVGCLKGQCFALELKTPVGRLKDIQRHRLEGWHAAGALIGVPRSPEEAIAMATGEEDGSRILRI